MRRLFTFLLALVLCLGLTVPALAAPFSDVSADAYYAQPIAWAAEQRITEGATPTTFDPDGLCTRGHIITFLWRAAGCPASNGISLFSNVSRDRYYTDALRWAVQEGIADASVSLRPDAPCTRAEAVTFLWRYAGSPGVAVTDRFADVPAGADCAQAVEWALENGVTNGRTETTFAPGDTCKNPIGQYTSDDQGFVYIENLPDSGRYYLREMENDGYIVDTQLKTVYVTAGTTTEITWENTAITGQLQVTKTSEDYNSMNGWAAGTPIPGTEFEIYHYRTGNLVDTIRTDKNGVAVSRPLPLGRYQIVESKAADFYGLDKTPIDVEIEYAGQIVKAAMTNKSLYTNVSIKKTGYVEVMPGQEIRYDLSDIANNSTTALTSFYWRDTLPVNAVRLSKIVTGTYNVQGNYKIVFKTNLNGEYRTMYDNLSTMQNNVLDASPAALGLASNEYVTEFMFSFGVVPANFRQVEAPRVYCNVVSWLTGGTQFSNQADVGGVHNGQWIMATSRWVTNVYKPSKPLPRTGY